MKTDLPLKGKTIVLTRAQSQQNESRKLFESFGARILDLPALVIGPPLEWGPLDDALDEIEDFHWIIFSSGNAIFSVEQRLQNKNMSLSQLPKTLKIAVVGRKTFNVLKQFGVNADFVPPDFIADSLIDNFPTSGAGLRMLLPRVQSGGRTVLAESFGKAGAHVLEVSAYETTCPEKIPLETADALDRLEVDAITFTSGKTVAHTSLMMNNHFGKDWKEKFNHVKIISIGPQTSLMCQKYFAKTDKEAKPYDMKGLVEACICCLHG